MRKLSEINESLWMDSIKRANSDVVRKEDKSRFDDDFKKIVNSEHIDFGFNSGLLWTPFNFGSDSEFTQGKFMTEDDVDELSEYLKDKGYRIATAQDWQSLVDFTSVFYYKNKDTNTWYYSFSRNGIDKELVVPNFGFISGYYSKNNLKDKITKPAKNDYTYYLIYDSSYIGYTILGMNNGHGVNKSIFPHGEFNDKVQIRLVKIKK